MSWFSKLTGIHLGNVGAPIGAAIGSFIPGVGTALGAGLGQALGSVGSGHSVGQAAAQGVGAYGITKGVSSMFGGSGASAGGSGGGDGVWFDPNTGEEVDPNTPGAVFSPQTGGDGGLTGLVKGIGNGISKIPVTSGANGGNGLSWADILKGAGSAASGVANYAEQEAARKQQADQFNQSIGLQKQIAGQNYGLAQNQQGLTVQSLLNRAPLADKAQYLAMNAAPPQAFQPRDYTQGLSQIQPGAAPQGGAQAQLAANNAASANYRPGAGGVDTSTLKLILSRLGGGASPSPSYT